MCVNESKGAYLRQACSLILPSAKVLHLFGCAFALVAPAFGSMLPYIFFIRTNMIKLAQIVKTCPLPISVRSANLKYVFANIRFAVSLAFLAFCLGCPSLPAHEIRDGRTDNDFRGQALPVALRSSASGIPFVDIGIHDVNNIKLTVKNNGIVGPDTYAGGGLNALEFMMHPSNTANSYATPYLTIGGVVGRDTLVSHVLEFWPAPLEDQFGHGEEITYESINDTSRSSLGAKSEQDIKFVYYDTLTDPLFAPIDAFDSRRHTPLNLRITHNSYAWSFEFAENFILFDYQITNVGSDLITKMWIGLEVRGGFAFDIFSGYKDTAKAFQLKRTSCEFTDDVEIFWASDNDGNPVAGSDFFDASAPTSATGIKILRTPDTAHRVNYNWWDDSGAGLLDWGPRKAATADRPFRDLGGHLGSPIGDRNRYSVMTNGEFDYDVMFSALDHTADGWLPPPAHAVTLANAPGFGNHNHHFHLISVGPFILRPGESAPFTFAYAAGEGFHNQTDNLLNPLDPIPFREKLNFRDLVKNISWASWVYDNPGIDTDGDDYSGEYRICVNSEGIIVDTTIVSIDTTFIPPDTILDTVFMIDSTFGVTSADTIFFTGDGVPDFRAATPPPAPAVRFTPSNGRILIEWNGLRSENTPDIFSKQLDFEGYRVYLGVSQSRTGMAIQSSYDIEDFTQFYFNPRGGGTGRWEILREPFSLVELQDAYAAGSRDYDPLLNGLDNPIRIGDSLFYFISQDWNQSNLRDTLAIHKAFPNEPYPHTLIIDSAFTSELTSDGRFKYFEYRYLADNLLPSVKYFVSVTAFDFGSQEASLPFLETNPVTSAEEVFALDRIGQSDGLDVIVYPNPYRIDGRYRDLGFEARDRESFPKERTRELHFIQLPPICEISIYSLDGDLIHTITHDQPPTSTTVMHESWDLITRNLQMSVSGIYYFVIETPDGQTQIGKFVLIM